MRGIRPEESGRIKRTLIIAEAGVNHNGSAEIARRLVDTAKESGADAVKFQTFKAERIASRFADKAAYQKMNVRGRETHLAMLKRLELSAKDHRDLAEHCQRRGLEFLSSPFDEESADFLEKIGVRRFKIPSGEITNFPLLSHIGRKRKPVILSTGMATLGEIERALEVLGKAGAEGVSLLHCVTEYPAPFDEINLRAIHTMKEAFRIPVGYSDHTMGNEIAIAAVALGAEIIEKHFTLDRSLEGPDHKASLEPRELKEMISAIRHVESALGNGRKAPARCEVKNMAVARKSIVASKSINKGEKITPAKIAIKRPGNGIQPQDWQKILGLTVNRKISSDEVIQWSDFR